MAWRHQGPRRACRDEMPQAQRSRAPSLVESKSPLRVSDPQNLSVGGTEGKFDENVEMGTKNNPSKLLAQHDSVSLC